MLREYLQKIEIFFLSYKSTWYFRYPQILGIIVDSSILFIKVDNFFGNYSFYVIFSEKDKKKFCFDRPVVIE